MKKILLRTFLCFTLFWSCNGNSDFEKIPLSRPWKFSTNKSLDLYFKSTDSKIYTFEFNFKHPAINYKNPEVNLINYRQKIWKMVGGDYQDPETKKWIKSTVLLKLKAKIWEINIEEKKQILVKDETVSSISPTSWGEDSINTEIFKIKLDRNKHYHFNIELLTSAADFESVDTAFSIKEAYLGK
jgi:hypothetical protein